jgi:hypothetical protein
MISDLEEGLDLRRVHDPWVLVWQLFYAPLGKKLNLRSVSDRGSFS